MEKEARGVGAVPAATRRSLSHAVECSRVSSRSRLARVLTPAVGLFCRVHTSYTRDTTSSPVYDVVSLALSSLSLEATIYVRTRGVRGTLRRGSCEPTCSWVASAIACCYVVT